MRQLKIICDKCEKVLFDGQVSRAQLTMKGAVEVQVMGGDFTFCDAQCLGEFITVRENKKC